MSDRLLHFVLAFGGISVGTIFKSILDAVGLDIAEHLKKLFGRKNHE